VSRAAKGADCKSAGYAFVGSSPTSPTSLRLLRRLRLGKPRRGEGCRAEVAKQRGGPKARLVRRSPTCPPEPGERRRTLRARATARRADAEIAKTQDNLKDGRPFGGRFRVARVAEIFPRYQGLPGLPRASVQHETRHGNSQCQTRTCGSSCSISPAVWKLACARRPPRGRKPSRPRNGGTCSTRSGCCTSAPRWRATQLVAFFCVVVHQPEGRRQARAAGEQRAGAARTARTQQHHDDLYGHLFPRSNGRAEFAAAEAALWN
jgi:hypothetical protein